MNIKDKFKFSVKTYQTGINWCVDVPTEITNAHIIDKERINIKGEIKYKRDFTVEEIRRLNKKVTDLLIEHCEVVSKSDWNK